MITNLSDIWLINIGLELEFDKHEIFYYWWFHFNHQGWPSLSWSHVLRFEVDPDPNVLPSKTLELEFKNNKKVNGSKPFISLRWRGISIPENQLLNIFFVLTNKFALILTMYMENLKSVWFRIAWCQSCWTKSRFLVACRFTSLDWSMFYFIICKGFFL